MQDWIYQKYSRFSEKAFYSLNKLQSFYPAYDKFLIIGARQIGKTFAVKEKIIFEFFTKKKQFIWARDNLDALKELKECNCKKFFEDLLIEENKCSNFLKNAKIHRQGNSIFLNNEIAGYFVAVSTFQNKKGSAYNNISTFVFDEFIDEKAKRQEKRKVEKILGTLKSIFGIKKNGCCAYLLANAIDKSDELLQLWNLQITNFGFYKNKNRKMILHYCDDSKAYKKVREESFCYGFYKNTYLEDYFDCNKFLENDLSTMIADVPPKATHACTLILNEYCKLRIYTHNSIIYCANCNNQKTTAIYFTKNPNEVTDKVYFFDRTQQEILVEHFKNKNIFFTNTIVKSNFLKFLRLVK